MHDLLYIFIIIELVLTLLTKEFFLVTRTFLHLLNKKYFRSPLYCNLIFMYDWEYFKKTHNYENSSGKTDSIELMHRLCKISGREEVEQLPRFYGSSTFKKIKKI